MSSALLPINQSTTLRDLFKILFRRKNVIIVSFVSCMAMFLAGMLYITPTYTATSKILISAEKQVNKDLYHEVGFIPKMEIGATPAEILNSYPVLEPVVTALELHKRTSAYELTYCPLLKRMQIHVQERLSNLDLFTKGSSEKPALRSPVQSAVARLKGEITATTVSGSRILSVSVTDISPENATLIANAVVRSYVSFDIKQQIAMLFEKYGERHPIVRPLLDHIAFLEQNLATPRLGDTEAIGPASVKIIEQASTPIEPSGISKITLLLFTVITGIFVSLALGFAFEYLDQTVKSPDDVEALLGIPVLGVLYGSQKISSEKRSRTFENAALQINLMLRPAKANCIVFTGASRVDNAESAVIACSKAFPTTLGLRTLLVDANLRNINKNALLKPDAREGLVSLIRGTHTISETIVETSPKFWVLPAGDCESIHPSLLFHAETLPDCIARLRSEFDMVFINAPDVLSYNDALALSIVAGQSVVVVAERSARKQTILKSLDVMKKAGVSLLGSMVINHEEIIPSLFYERL